MGNVVVVGSVNVDFVVTVERLPQAGQTVSGGSFQRFGGGKGANQTVQLPLLTSRAARSTRSTCVRPVPLRPVWR